MISKFSGESITGTSCCRNGLDSHVITAHPVPGNDNYAMLKAISDYAADKHLRIVRQDIFGPCRMLAGSALLPTSSETPFCWLEGDGEMTDQITAIQAYAVKTENIEPVKINGRTIGYIYEDDDARFCSLGGLMPSDISASREEQAKSIFEIMELALNSVSMNFNDMVR